MKYLVSALAFAPLLIAATPAPPEAPRAPRALVIERVDAPAAPGRHGRVVLDFSVDGDTSWSEEHDAILDNAMARLREALAALPGDVDSHVRYDWRSGEFDRAAIRARVEGARAREAGMMARLNADEVRVIGLRAGARGMEAGLSAIDEVLERNEITRRGETRPLTAEEREELLAARARLQARIADFREEHAVFLGEDRAGERRVMVMRRADGERPARAERSERRRVRVEDRDGRLRVWLDGEELEGDALTAWLNSDEGQRMIRQRPEPPLAGGE